MLAKGVADQDGRSAGTNPRAASEPSGSVGISLSPRVHVSLGAAAVAGLQKCISQAAWGLAFKAKPAEALHRLSSPNRY